MRAIIAETGEIRSLIVQRYNNYSGIWESSMIEELLNGMDGFEVVQDENGYIVFSEDEFEELKRYVDMVCSWRNQEYGDEFWIDLTVIGGVNHE